MELRHLHGWDLTPTEAPKGEVVGHAVRTRTPRKDPVFVSQGNRIRLRDAAVT